MKRIKTNNNDCSFENKYKFEDLLLKFKAFSGSIIRNGKKTGYMGLLVGTVLIGASSFYTHGKSFIDMTQARRSASESNDDNKEETDEEVLEFFNNSILVSSTSTKVEQKYYIENNILYDNDGNRVILTDSSVPVVFPIQNVNSELFENIDLVSSKTEILYFDYSNIDDTFVEYLPESLQLLSLNNCNFITNLNELPNKCPNLMYLSLDAMPSIRDLSFIYDLKNLKGINIADSAYITDELLNYLKDNDIETNVTEEDVINSKRVDEIIESIITPDMTDREKIQAVCLYVLNNVEYDYAQTVDSNRRPLRCVLEDGKGVCASYAYFTNVLLNKANINSYEVVSNKHGWNLIELDDKYYYIDTTNMDAIKFYNFLLKTLNISSYYMIDTNLTSHITSMEDPTSDKVLIPISLIEDISAGREDKDLIEKYGGLVGDVGILVASLLYAVSIYLGFEALSVLQREFPRYISKIKRDYEDILDSSYRKK